MPIDDGDKVAVRRALISVSDKTGIVDFCQRLAALEVALLATGSTARLLQEQGLSVCEAADYTGQPEILGGRVKTLHPRIHGGILARRDRDRTAMQEQDILPIDLVVGNLYPFEKVAAAPDSRFEQLLENIDIGGPALLRAAAKNHAWVGAVVEPGDYEPVAAELEANDACLSRARRFQLACKAFAHTANYDANIANYLGAVDDRGRQNADFPQTWTAQFHRRAVLRYGENPHQKAAFYTEPAPANGTLAAARQLQGKELSYNNMADSDAGLECVLQFAEPACVIVKHANPCGAALGDSAHTAWQRAYAADPVSAFGGIIAFNRPLDADTAAAILKQQFAEIILCPEASPEALAVCARKPALRLLRYGQRCPSAAPCAPPVQLNLKRVSGGLLMQDNDRGAASEQALCQVTARAPEEAERRDLLFAWRVVKFVKSNAVVYCRRGQTVGIGAGQMSRIYSARIAAIKARDAKLSLSGAVMASDAFFPFRDSVDQAAEMGIRAIIQPGGSRRDQEIINAADGHGISMLFTGMRHFLH